MSISDTLQSKKYASIAETAAAQAKLSAEKLDNAPDYAAEAEQYAIQAQAAYESTVTASSGAINAANSASTSAIDAANSAASAGSAAEDAVVGYSERSIRTPVGEVISELPAESERQDTLLSFNSTGGIQVKSLNDFASLGSDGKIPVSQIPSVALTEVYTVASESEMLLLVAEEGDIAIRTDISQTFVLLQSPSSALANWKLLLNDALVQLQTNGDKKIASSYGGSVFSDYSNAQYYKSGTFSVGGTINNPLQAVQGSGGTWWFYTGTLPKIYSASTDPASDSLWYAAGLLNGIPINNCRAWFASSSTTDNTVNVQRFLRTMTYLQTTAILSGDLLTTSRVQCDCDIDGSECNWYISSGFDSTGVGGSGAVLLIKDPQTNESTGNSFATSNIGQVQHVQLSSSTYSNCSVGIEGEGSNNYAYLRNGTTNIPNSDLFVMDGGTTGMHPDTPALFKFFDTAKFIVRPLRTLRTIKGPKFIMTSPLTGSRSLRTCIGIERNNTVLDGGYFNAQILSIIAESYVSLKYVTDCFVDNVSMPNANTTNSNYLVLGQCTNRLTIRNCHAPSGWALTDGNFMRNTVVQDSSGATIGCHAMAWNFTVERCEMFPISISGSGYQGGIGVTGGGLLKVRDITYTYMGGDRALDHPVATRGDYGQGWEGTIDVQGVTVNYNAIPSNSGQGCAIVYIQGAVNGSIDLTRNCYLGKRVSIKDVVVKIGNASFAQSDVVLNTAYFQTTFTQTVQYPSEYNVENFDVETSGIPTSNFTLDPRWILLVSNTSAMTGSCRMTFKNIRWPSISIGFIGAAASTIYRITPSLIIEDSKSTLYLNLLAISTGSASIRRTTIGNLALGNANSSGTYYIERCNISGTSVGGSPAGSDVAYFYENHITTTSTVTIGTVAKYCHGNTVIAGGSISGKTVDEWYSYRDTSVFRTT